MAQRVVTLSWVSFRGEHWALLHRHSASSIEAQGGVGGDLATCASLHDVDDYYWLVIINGGF